jgi:alpha-D-ribose 1-methylphosphonate 5-phosphate C-P lyase
MGRFTAAGERLPDDEVTHYWDAVKRTVSECGHDVDEIPMPRGFRVYTKVPRRDYARFLKTHTKEARERQAIEEHGRIVQADETGAYILAATNLQ